MKMKNFLRRHKRFSAQRGQTFIPIMVLIGLLLLAMLGVAVDYSQVWAHRQMAQGAADAACQAGAADLYVNAVDPSSGGTKGLESFIWIGASTFTCDKNAGTPPCQYASFNGYGGAAAANVQVSFPATVPGVTIPDAFNVSTPFLKVTVTDSVPTTLSKLASSTSSVTITASATCGVSPVNVPVPLVILHQSANSSFAVTGSSKVVVLGGPTRAIEVNSSSTTAVNVSSTADTVNLSQAGPDGKGADFAVFGGPSSQPSGIDVGSEGHYLYPATPFGDPFITIAAPTKPANKGSAHPVPFRINGCPDPRGCVEFTPGDYTGCTNKGNINPGDQGCLLLPYTGNNPGFTAAGMPIWVAGHKYTQGTLIQPTNGQGNNGSIFLATNTGTSGGGAPNFNSAKSPCAPQADGTCSGATVTDNGAGGVLWQNVGTVVFNQLTTGIFDPGLYYVDTNGLSFGSNSTGRVSTATGDGSDGVMFYFSTSGTVSVTSDSGKSPTCASVSVATPGWSGNPVGCAVSYTVSGGLSSQATGYISSPALKCPNGGAVPGAVPATLNGNILLGPCGGLAGNPGISGNYGSNDGNRGFLFFQNRSKSANPSWGGGGQFLSSGFMYFTSGSGSKCGTSTSCLTLQGGSGSQSFTLGNIVVDELGLGGNPNITMILNPTATFAVLRPTLLQ